MHGLAAPRHANFLQRGGSGDIACVEGLGGCSRTLRRYHGTAQLRRLRRMNRNRSTSVLLAVLSVLLLLVIRSLYLGGEDRDDDPPIPEAIDVSSSVPVMDPGSSSKPVDPLPTPVGPARTAPKEADESVPEVEVEPTTPLPRVEPRIVMEVIEYDFGPDGVGRLRGRVLFQRAPVPERGTIEVADGSGAILDDPRLLVAKNRGIANAVIEIEVDETELATSKEQGTIEIRGSHFDPHVILLRTSGSSISIVNRDGFEQIVHTYSRRSKHVNVKLAPDERVELGDLRPEAWRVSSDGKPWMSAYVYVARSELADLSGDAVVTQVDGSELEQFGAVSIDGIPNGEHRITFWHETLGTLERQVSFPLAEGAVVEFDPKPE